MHETVLVNVWRPRAWAYHVWAKGSAAMSCTRPAGLGVVSCVSSLLHGHTGRFHSVITLCKGRSCSHCWCHILLSSHFIPEYNR
eukprot:scaffold117442_cov20-Prasinocladus_malaysianus.AAC.1